MTATSTSSPYPGYYREESAHRWLSGALAALLILVGVAVLISIVVPLARGENPNWGVDFAPGTWVWQLIGLVVGLWILVWVVRLLVIGFAGPGYWSAYYGPRWYRHYYRHGGFGEDPALAIARDRYARGEITREQFDQISRDLGRPIS